jgi:hypothetical protein
MSSARFVIPGRIGGSSDPELELLELDDELELLELELSRNVPSGSDTRWERDMSGVRASVDPSRCVPEPGTKLCGGWPGGSS